MRALVTTQYLENYAAHDWDGKGPVPQGWKFKGQYEYVVQVPDVLSAEDQKLVLDWMIGQVVRGDNYTEEYLLGTALVPVGELTPQESYFEELLLDGIADEADRSGYAPAVLTPSDALAELLLRT